MNCALEYCERKSKNDTTRLCDGHYRQKRAGKPLTPLRAYKRQPASIDPYQKHCNRCDTTKRKTAFNRYKNGRLLAWCRECQSKYQQAT